MPRRPHDQRPRALARIAFAAALAAAMPAAAQDAGKSGFFTRGFGGLLGGGGQPDDPGAYVSPSAIPAPEAPAALGVPQQARPPQRLDPIALPDAAGHQPAAALDLPSIPAYAPANLPALDLQPERRRLVLEARLVKDGAAIPTGLVWRLFAPRPGPDGKLPLVATATGGTASFEVPAGAYLMHVGFGRAGVTRRVDFSGAASREDVVLDAGGLKLDAVATGNVPIPPDKLVFDIYSQAPQERDRRLLASDIQPGAVVPLNAGAYHVVSRYGDENAEVQADVKVEAGKTTDVTLQHRAAQLTMKLVREAGGEAIADTAWQVFDTDGDTVRESVGAFPSMVLGEGEYLIVAKNKDKTYQRDFRVEAGVNTDVEVRLDDLQTEGDGSGD